MPLFCRHNRLTSNCPICSREAEAARKPPPRAAGSRSRGAGAAVARRASPGRAGSVVTRRLARAADDGYRHDLIPGVRATADAERLAACLVLATERLEFPGPHPAIAEEQEREQATWLAFLVALAGPDRPHLQDAVLSARPPWAGGDPAALELGPHEGRTVEAYRAWVARAGSQEAAFTGEAAWTPQRRFARVFDRLALPGFGRAARYELLVTLGAAGLYEVEGDALHVGDDATSLAAKRALNSGDTMLLERRAAALASGVGVPVAALDHGLALWDSPRPVQAPEGDRLERVRAALGLA